MESDASILWRSLAEPEAFGEIYQRHGAALTRYAVSRVGVSSAEDVVADTILAAFRVRRRYDFARDNARPWLYGIEANVIRNLARRRSARPLAEPPSVDMVSDLIEQLTAREELVARVAPSLRRGELLLFRMLADGYSYREIGAALGRPAGTVRSMVHRARRRLRGHDVRFRGRGATFSQARDNNRVGGAHAPPVVR